MDEGQHICGMIITPSLAGRLMLGYARLLDIPDDAELTQIYYEPLRRSFVLLFEHPSFAPIPVGELAPLVMVHVDES